jgi:hypothetical protein
MLVVAILVAALRDAAGLPVEERTPCEALRHGLRVEWPRPWEELCLLWGRRC